MSEPNTPTAEFLDKIRKKLHSNPLSLSAMAYREILSEGPEMTAKENELIRQAFLEGYKQAFSDIKEATSGKDNEKEPGEINEWRTEGATLARVIASKPKPNGIVEHLPNIGTNQNRNWI